MSDYRRSVGNGEINFNTFYIFVGSKSPVLANIFMEATKMFPQYEDPVSLFEYIQYMDENGVIRTKKNAFWYLNFVECKIIAIKRTSKLFGQSNREQGNLESYFHKLYSDNKAYELINNRKPASKPILIEGTKVFTETIRTI